MSTLTYSKRDLKTSNRTTITKCELIRSVMSERLLSGAWIAGAGSVSNMSRCNEKGYMACAVGSLLRYKVPGDMTVLDFIRLCDSTRNIRVINQLVEYFDELGRILPAHGSLFRYLVVKHIENNFPDTVDLVMPDWAVRSFVVEEEGWAPN